jgi:hypothetical protein
MNASWGLKIFWRVNIEPHDVGIKESHYYTNFFLFNSFHFTFLLPFMCMSPGYNLSHQFISNAATNP